MAANGKLKLKLLYIRRMLEEETDSEHGLSMRQIIEHLNELGIEAERKSVYRDIDLLREFGLDIRVYQRNPVEYALGRRDFNLAELMLLVDAVESSKFLTRRQANVLIGNIKSLASESQRVLLDRRVHVTGRIKSKYDGVFQAIGDIHSAIRSRKKVSFRYLHYGCDGKRHATLDGARRLVTPVGISYDEGFYYLTVWSEKHESFREYRIDRMDGLRVSEEAATRNDQITHYMFDDNEFEYFGRFDGPEETVTLSVKEDKIEIVMDRFGEHVHVSKLNDDTAQAIVKVRVSEQFFGWIVGMGGKVTIVKPEKLIHEYKSYLKKLMDEC